MVRGYTARVELKVNAPPARVWQALTDPEMIRQYLFGTQVETDWQVGSPIIYKGTWQGKEYEDKGMILEMVPNRRFRSTYWSSMGGLPDEPENYATVTYDLTERDGRTELVLTQDNNTTEDDRNHAQQNWQSVLTGLKKLVEKPAV